MLHASNVLVGSHMNDDSARGLLHVLSQPMQYVSKCHDGQKLSLGVRQTCREMQFGQRNDRTACGRSVVLCVVKERLSLVVAALDAWCIHPQQKHMKITAVMDLSHVTLHIKGNEWDVLWMRLVLCDCFTRA